MKYPVVIEQSKNEELSFKILLPDLPGCQEKSATIDGAFEKIKQAIKSHLAILAEYGEAIPRATSIEKHRGNYPDAIWGIVDIDITPYLGKSHKINVTLPELLIQQIDDRVSKSAEYKTRSGFIASACLSELAK